MSDSNENFEPVETIFAGRRFGKSKYIIFYSVNEPQETFAFDSPKVLRRFRNAVIGGIYQHDRNSSTFQLSDKYVRDSHDDRIAEWRAADEACEVALRATKRIQQGRDGSKAAIAHALTPFRAEYAATDRIGKLALEVVLLAALRSTI